jgi:hypothetical protein
VETRIKELKEDHTRLGLKLFKYYGIDIKKFKQYEVLSLRVKVTRRLKAIVSYESTLFCTHVYVHTSSKRNSHINKLIAT